MDASLDSSAALDEESSSSPDVVLEDTEPDVDDVEFDAPALADVGIWADVEVCSPPVSSVVSSDCPSPSVVEHPTKHASAQTSFHAWNVPVEPSVVHRQIVVVRVDK